MLEFHLLKWSGGGEGAFKILKFLVQKSHMLLHSSRKKNNIDSSIASHLGVKIYAHKIIFTQTISVWSNTLCANKRLNFGKKRYTDIPNSLMNQYALHNKQNHQLVFNGIFPGVSPLSPSKIKAHCFANMFSIDIRLRTFCTAMDHVFKKSGDRIIGHTNRWPTWLVTCESLIKVKELGFAKADCPTTSK